LEIGVLGGDPTYELNFAVSAIRTADGRYAVVSGGSELRFFDQAGVHERTVGRSGEGPGEFRVLNAVYRFRGDSLATYDRSLRRVTIFDSLGDVGRIVELASPDGRLSPALAGVFDDGSLLVLATARMTASLGTGVHRLDGQVLRYDTSGLLLQLISPLDTQESALFDTALGQLLAPRAFTRNGWAVTDGNLVYVGDNERYEIRVFESDGTLVRIQRRSGQLTAVTPEMIADFSREHMARAGSDEERRLVESMLESMPYPETLPAYGPIHVAPDGSLWVQVVTLPGDSTVAYSVFDPIGAWVGDVTLPIAFQLLDVGTDYVLGRTVDDLGVERISVYSIPGS
jgi:hypothetical protein